MKKLSESYFCLFEIALTNLQVVKKESSTFRTMPKTISTSNVRQTQ